MPFYDIMLLYKAYSDYVDEENKEQEKQQAKYEEEMEDYKKPSLDDYKIPDMTSNINNLTKGFTTPSIGNFSMPKF